MTLVLTDTLLHLLKMYCEVNKKAGARCVCRVQPRARDVWSLTHEFCCMSSLTYDALTRSIKAELQNNDRCI